MAGGRLEWFADVEAGRIVDPALARELRRVVIKEHWRWKETGGRVCLTGARISGADFSRADLVAAELSGVRGREARFDGAQMYGVRAHRADFAGASFRKSRGEPAWLMKADLRGARLEGARGPAASWEWADLHRTAPVPERAWRGAGRDR